MTSRRLTTLLFAISLLLPTIASSAVVEADVTNRGADASGERALGRISGTVGGPDGARARARVTLHPSGARTNTDGAGRFAFEGLAAGTYRVTAAARGYLSAVAPQLRVDGGTREVALVLDRGVKVTAEVTDPAGRPLPRISAYVAQGPTYQYGVTGETGEVTLAPVEPGDYRIGFYGEGVESRAVDARAGEAPTRVVLRPLPPQVQAFSQRQVFAPHEPVEIGLRAFRVGAVTVAAYRLADDGFADGTGPAALVRAPGARPVYEKTVTVRYRRAYTWRYLNLALPIAAPGAYVVEVSTPSGPTRVPILVSDLGLVVKRAPDEVLVWATHLGTGEPFAGAEVSLRAAGAVIVEGRVDGDGVFRAPVAANVPVRVVGNDGDGGNPAVVAAPLATDALGTLQAYVYTDRPVYRPGQQVFYKAIVRRTTADGHAVPAGETVRIQVRDALGQPVSESQSLLSATGTTSGNLVLASEPPLGLYTIELSLGEESATGAFKVFEYRKPEFEVEVSTDRPHYAGGDTVALTCRGSYYFGGALAGAAVRWSAFATPFVADADDHEWGGEEYEASYGQLVGSGEATLDAEGTATASFQVPDLGDDMRLSIEVAVTDGSERTVTGRASAVAARADFRIEAWTSSYVARPGLPLAISMRALDFEGSGVATAAEVTVTRRTWHRSHGWRDEEVLVQPLASGPDGSASVELPGQPEGYYAVRVGARDGRGRKVEARAWFWVVSGSFAAETEDLGTIEIVLDRRAYRPGETARAIIKGLPAGGAVLVTTERDRIRTAEVRRAAGNVLVVDVPLADGDAPNVYLAASAVRAGVHRARAVSIPVRALDRRLVIEIRTDHESYRPGDIARVDLEVRDGHGRPTAAEVSLGVVDEAIYGISEELAPDIVRFFHGARPNRVMTVYSFAQRLLGGADKDARERVRRNFKDTAFWAPALTTDGSGHLSVSFPWPDNLTTWRLTARALGDRTAVGSAAARTLVTQPLVSRIHAPRFLVAGDRSEVDVVVNDRSGRNRDLWVTLDVEGPARIEDGKERHGALSANGETRFGFVVSVTGPGKVGLGARVEDRSGTSPRPEDDRDALQIALPSLPFGRPFSVVANGDLGGAATSEVTLSVPPGAVRESIAARVTLSPGLASSAFGALDDLIGYPYGCAEQTMSRFLPTVIASGVARTMGASLGPKAAEVPRMVADGTGKLYGYQHADGGWGWWRDDPTHPYMTAYVTWGLYLARKAGFPIDSDRLERGLAATAAQLAAAEDPNTVAFMLHTLAEAGRGDRNRAAALFAERARLSDYGRGLLLETLAALGDRERAAVLKRELMARAVLGGASEAHWDAETWNEGWMKNPVEATAYVLRGIVADDPQSPAAAHVARWLVMNRRGSSWHSTKDSAAAVQALLGYAQAREPRPDARISVAIDGLTQHEVDVRGYESLAAGALELRDLDPGQHRLSVARAGTGNVYYAARVTGVVAADSIAAEGGALRVRRSYAIAERVADGPGRYRVVTRPLAGPVAAGTLLQVELEVFAEADTEYVMLEDPLAAGFEVVDEPQPIPPCDDCQEQGAGRDYDRREVRDEKVVFFRTRVDHGVWRLAYLVKAETVGAFRVLPARVEAVYQPGVEGHGASHAIEVLPR